MTHPARFEAAEVLLPGTPFDETLAWFLGLGFAIDAIGPADAPRYASISAFGLRLRLDVGFRGQPGELRILHDAASPERTETAPNGTAVHFVAARPPIACPEPKPHLVIAGDGPWGTGRAGMAYRDLLPCRWGGHAIASHIRIERGGPVPDYVHFHRVAFQVIVCLRGEVEVVYEDQGPPFVMRAGDAVLQPPGIRHRVLHCSDGLEVLEVGSPAEHETHADRSLALPTAAIRTTRAFSGQRFARCEAAGATWFAGPSPGWSCSETPIGAASGDRVAVRHRVAAPGSSWRGETDSGDPSALRFWFVRAGRARLDVAHNAADSHRGIELREEHSVAMPASHRFVWTVGDEPLELVEVCAPATPTD